MDPYLNTIEFAVLCKGNGWALARTTIYCPGKPPRGAYWNTDPFANTIVEYSICPVLPMFPLPRITTRSK